jgi:hypothetical protein
VPSRSGTARVGIGASRCDPRFRRYSADFLPDHRNWGNGFRPRPQAQRRLLAIPYFEETLRRFRAEFVNAADIRNQSVTKRLVIASLPLIVAHSINSTDALTLKSALALARRLRRDGDDRVLVASDQRLLRAAGAEGLITFDPEMQDNAALVALLV